MLVDPNDPEQARHDIIKALVVRIFSLAPNAQMEVLTNLDPEMVKDLIEYISTLLPEDQKEAFVKMVLSIQQGYRPQTDDELWRYFRDECGLTVPRVAVCEGHCSPFDFAADVYFERGVKDKVAVGNRGSGKTLLMGTLHAINSRTKPMLESATIGAIEKQAKKCYSYLKIILERTSWEGVADPKKIQMSETYLKNGSRVEVITGTMSGVNSPHPQIAHFDEIELFRGEVYEEAIHMAQSANGYQAQNIGTSSWKKPRGRLTQIIEEVEKQILEGKAPGYDIYKWCWAETSVACEYDCSACPFFNVVKGTWADGTERTFEQECKKGSKVYGEGRLKRSEGFVPVSDSISRFQKLSRRQWDAQQGSKKPSVDGLIYDVFDEDIHFINDRNWMPDPDLGLIDVSIDFGGGNPHAVIFWQTLDYELELESSKVLKEGSHIAFNEIYLAQIGNVELGKMINRMISAYEEVVPGFEVNTFFCDPAAKSARLDLIRLPSYGGVDDDAYRSIKTVAKGRASVGEGIDIVYEIIKEDQLYIVKANCPNLADEIQSYERNKETGQPIKTHDHAVDSMRYRFYNRHLGRGISRKNSDGPRSLPKPGKDKMQGLETPRHAKEDRALTRVTGLPQVSSRNRRQRYEP